MIQRENLDVRAITLGINLLDCHRDNVNETCRLIQDKIGHYAGNLVQTCDEVSSRYGIPVVNKRLAVTPVAHIGAGYDRNGYVKLAKALDQAAKAVGVDIVGGFSADVSNGMNAADQELIASIPTAA